MEPIWTIEFDGFRTAKRWQLGVPWYAVCPCGHGVLPGPGLCQLCHPDLELEGLLTVDWIVEC